MMWCNTSATTPPNYFLKTSVPRVLVISEIIMFIRNVEGGYSIQTVQSTVRQVSCVRRLDRFERNTNRDHLTG